VPPALAQRIVTAKLLRGPVYEGVGQAVAAAFDAAATPTEHDSGGPPAGFTVALGLKDLRLAAAAAGAAGLPMPVADAVRATLARAVAAGLGDGDWGRLPRLGAG
jgi:3-hydroxyisobutyrate dehydrogenase-like beta-hydroxyacid dehydrogenase